jgi:hypothetical protein
LNKISLLHRSVQVAEAFHSLRPILPRANACFARVSYAQSICRGGMIPFRDGSKKHKVGLVLGASDGYTGL